MDSPAPGRQTFGPPQVAVGAFAWAALQLPRALWWQMRAPELRALTVAPALWTLVLGLLAALSAVVAAGALTSLVVPPGAWWHLLLRAVLTLVLLIAAALGTWQLQSAIAAPLLERMTLVVQREVLGVAPPASNGLTSALRHAISGVLPNARRLSAWLLSAALGATLVLVPGIGPVLVIPVQAVVAAIFLAHGAITDNRQRLGLPRRLLLREPALVLGLAVACVPLMLFPPSLLFAGGTVHIAGALVALGCHRRFTSAGSRAEAPAPSAPGSEAPRPPTP